MLLKKYSDLGGGEKNNLIQSFWQKKINILTLMLSGGKNWSECPGNNLMKKKPYSLNDTDKQSMNIGPNYLSCIFSQQQTS